jgi:hypothetical protein
MKRNKNNNDASVSSKSFKDFIQDCRNYGLSVSRERLIKSLDQFSDQVYRFAMSDDAKTMVVIIEAGDDHDDL